MKYYILRTNCKEDAVSSNAKKGFNFKINNLNAERLISDAKDEDIFYLLYHIPEGKFVEQGVIKSVESKVPSAKFETKFTNRSSLNISYAGYSTPNCGIIPTSKSKVDEILAN